MGFLRALAALPALAMIQPAVADLDWGVISTPGDPDPIHIFDLANPGGSNQFFGNVDGNFNRSMDFDSENSFYYYVSTDSLNDPGDRGLWYWNGGVNTQLFNVSFSDSGDGDGTLSNDLSRYYVTVDDGDGTDGDSLYVFDGLNGDGSVTFTEVGETGLDQIFALAMDPVTGVLYGYDSGTEALYTISTDDASPTFVGASGMSFGALGAMDFSADGSTMLMASIGGDLWTVDKTDGSLVSAGDVGLNASALSYRIPGPSALALLASAGLIGRRRRR